MNFNKQNKVSAHLNGQDYWLQKTNIINWMGAYLDKESFYLNSEAYKISPRRPKPIMEKIAEEYEVPVEYLFQEE
jgi:hypothetical protein